MGTTEIIIATAIVITLCGLAFVCARREDKQNADILNRLKELEQENGEEQNNDKH